MSILHPFKALRKALIKHIISEILKDLLPKTANIGFNYLDKHEDEFIDFVFDKVKTAIKDFISKKTNQAKDKIIKITDSNN